MYELTARPIDEQSFAESILLRDEHRDNEKLIVPTPDDWWMCAEAVRKLRLEQQRQHKGATPAMDNPTEFQNDALIARSAFMNKGVVVTADVADFVVLRRFMRFDYVAADHYFGV